MNPDVQEGEPRYPHLPRNAPLVPEPTPKPTLGQAIAGIDILAAVGYGGLTLVIVGSLGPWVTAPLGFSAGTDGDGKWTIILAVIGIYRIWRSGMANLWNAVGPALILAVGMYDAIEISHVASRVTRYGSEHVGWGVYAVIVGALVTLTSVIRGRSRFRGGSLDH